MRLKKSCIFALNFKVLKTPQEEYEEILPRAKEFIKGELVEELAEKMDCSVGSVYNYLGGRTPSTAVCSWFVYCVKQIFEEQGIVI